MSKNNGDGGCPSKFSLKNEYPNGLKLISSCVYKELSLYF